MYLKMSYFDRLRKHQVSYDLNGEDLPFLRSSLTPIPQDETQQIFNDKMGEQRDQLFEQATAPFTAVGATDLIRRGINAIPAVKDIQNAIKKGGEFADKVKDIVGSDNFQNFMDDPEGFVKNMASGAKQGLIDTLNQGVSRAQNMASTLGESADQLGDSIPTFDQATDQLSRAAGKIARAAGEGARQGVMGQTQDDSPAPDPPADEDEEAFHRRFQDALNEDGGPQPEEQQASVSEDQTPAQEEPTPAEDIPEEEFGDSVGQENIPEDIMEVRRINAANRDMANDMLNKYVLNQSGNDVEAANEAENVPDDVAKRSQMMEDFFNGKGGPSGAEQGAETQIAGEQAESAKLSQAAAEDAKDLADPAADSMTDAISKVAGEGAGEEGGEVAAGLGVADAIPVVGTALDLASIGGIIGEAVDYYNNKAKEAKDEAAEQRRQTAIQQDISEQQSELIGQARQQQQQQQQVSASQLQPSTGIPISQSGSEPK